MKQVIVLRADLNLSKGKAAAQAAHAAVAALEEARRMKPEWVSSWFDQGQKKIVLSAKDERQLIDLYNRAKALGLPAVLIRDAGLTEIPPGTLTALGIGPAPAKLVNRVTGSLPLYR